MGEETEIYRYAVFRVGNSDKEKFYLSYYGLPEPDFGERRISWIHYAFTAVGVFLIIFALWQMYSKHKESKA
jgi:hypothetical protein